MTRAPVAPALAFLLALALAGAAAAGGDEAWRPFAGTWTVTGQRQTLPTGGPHPAAVVQVSGAVVLEGGGGLGRGFRGEAIAYTDGDSLRVGRSVWTDERGDQVFAALSGTLLATGQRITGTITGGTGRYAGLVGTFEFSWQYAAEGGDGTLQGRAVELKGRVRGGGGAP